MKNLQMLYLRNNQLNELPAELGLLTNLQEFDLRNNHLRQLPLQLGQLSNLQNLDVSDNSDLLTPPPEIVARGTRAS